MSKRIQVECTQTELLLNYYPYQSLNWLKNKLVSQDLINIGKVFYFTKQDIINQETVNILMQNTEDIEDEIVFLLGAITGDYYKVPGYRLNIPQDVYFHKDIKLSVNSFSATRQVSIFKQISALSGENIYIGGNTNNAVPEVEFKQLISAIPTEYELKKYVSAKISTIIRNYLNKSVDAVSSYHKYINKKPSKKIVKVRTFFAAYEIDKYSTILEQLNQMLAAENQYSESKWQEAIKDILLIIYPQYLKAIREAPINDQRTKKIRIRKVDFLLVDTDGTVDVLEIKKPFNTAVVTHGTYRDNHIPLRELSGTVMQVEKYLYNLTRSGTVNEKKLTKLYGSGLPEGMTIKITNPRGMVLIGRDNNLSVDQRFDFEIIRRQYKNVLDIFTYDDLIRRMDAIICQFQSIQNEHQV